MKAFWLVICGALLCSMLNIALIKVAKNYTGKVANNINWDEMQASQSLHITGSSAEKHIIFCDKSGAQYTQVSILFKNAMSSTHDRTIELAIDSSGCYSAEAFLSPNGEWHAYIAAKKSNDTIYIHHVLDTAYN